MRLEPRAMKFSGSRPDPTKAETVQYDISVDSVSRRCGRGSPIKSLENRDLVES